jgi:hypothetical protein
MHFFFFFDQDACFCSDSNDGAIDLMWAEATDGVSSSKLLSIFLSGADKGTHVHEPFVRYVKVKAFTLEPLEERGVMDVDGEVWNVRVLFFFGFLITQLL